MCLLQENLEVEHSAYVSYQLFIAMWRICLQKTNKQKSEKLKSVIRDDESKWRWTESKASQLHHPAPLLEGGRCTSPGLHHCDCFESAEPLLLLICKATEPRTWAERICGCSICLLLSEMAARNSWSAVGRECVLNCGSCFSSGEDVNGVWWRMWPCVMCMPAVCRVRVCERVCVCVQHHGL